MSTAALAFTKEGVKCADCTVLSLLQHPLLPWPSLGYGCKGLPLLTQCPALSACCSQLTPFQALLSWHSAVFRNVGL